MTFDLPSYAWGIVTILGTLLFMGLLFAVISIIDNWYENTLMGKNKKLKQKIRELEKK